jgi:hydroxyacylglutathione hydrolase
MTKHFIAAVPALKDNYIWLLQHPSHSEVVAVDPGDAAPVLAYLKLHQKTLAAILITHHHADHTQGVAALSQQYSVPVYGAHNSQHTGITHRLQDQEEVIIPELALSLKTLAIPGHTLDHMAYYNNAMVFTGDTLFSAGCGRLFEGTAQQMWESLQRLQQLPDDTAVYCGHEYTLSNLAFAQTVEPKNQAVKQHIEHVQKIRALNQPSIPSTMGLEKQINPFLRTSKPDVMAAVEKHVGQTLKSPVDVFAHLRQWKNNF